MNKLFTQPKYQHRLMVYDFSEKKADAVNELIKHDACAPRREMSISETMKVVPNWIGQVSYTDPASDWNRTAKTLLDMEFTAKVLLIHQSRLKQDQDFESSICRGEKYTYRVSTGIGTLSFSRNIDWKSLRPIYKSSDNYPKSSPLELPTTHVDSLN